MEYKSTIFCLCFGEPKPFHRIILSNWSAQKTTLFKIITDHPQDWAVLSHQMHNISILEASPDDVFNKCATALGCESQDLFFQKYGHIIGIVNSDHIGGWSLCRFRPIFKDIYGVDTEWWGWIDYDVLINASHLSHNLAKNNIDAFYFTEEGPDFFYGNPQHLLGWEHFKIFRTSIDTYTIYNNLIQEYTALNKPIDFTAECAFLFQLINFNRENLRLHSHSLESFAINWKNINNCNIQKLQADIQSIGQKFEYLVNYNTGKPVVFLLADIQTKTFSQSQVDYILNYVHKNNRYIFYFDTTLN